jgi:hypothetical protein
MFQILHNPVKILQLIPTFRGDTTDINNKPIYLTGENKFCIKLYILHYFNYLQKQYK